MPRYFFNIHGCHDVFDATGAELEDRGELCIHMMATAAAMVQAEGATAGSWDMEVLNEMGKIVATMDFSVDTRKAKSKGTR